MKWNNFSHFSPLLLAALLTLHALSCAEPESPPSDGEEEKASEAADPVLSSAKDPDAKLPRVSNEGSDSSITTGQSPDPVAAASSDTSSPLLPAASETDSVDLGADNEEPAALQELSESAEAAAPSIAADTPLPAMPVKDPKRVLTGVRFFASFPSVNHSIRNAHEQLLAFPEWEGRWPYYTIKRSATTIDIHQDDQRVMDLDLVYAASAGLDYWLFEPNLLTPGNTLFNYPFDLYMKSANKGLLMFALSLGAEQVNGLSTESSSALASLVSALKDPRYLRLKGNRPPIFITMLKSFADALGSDEAARRIAAFSSLLTGKIGVKPLLVLFDLGAGTYFSRAGDFGFEAQSSYLGGYNARDKGAAYSSLVAANKAKWDSHTNSSVNYIPMATVGLDPRPKHLDPALFAFGKDPPWYQQGTPKEIAANIGKAIQWVKDHPTLTARTHTILISAWSEPTESGWLHPTIAERNQRLNALSRILGGNLLGKPVSPYDKNPPPPHEIGTCTLEPLPMIDGQPTLPLNAPIVIAGSAPIATRIRLQLTKNKIVKSSLFFINGKGTAKSRRFEVELPAVSVAGLYELLVSGDVTNLNIPNIRVK